MLYDVSKNDLVLIKENGFHLEKDLQNFVEDNMKALLDLDFLATEFWIDDHNRADSIGYDSSSNAFVIIEDKNVKDRGLVDQGFTYLAALLDRKERFVLLYNEKMGGSKQIKDFDWSQSRIVFISPEFNDRQIQSTSFNDMPFELWELKKYGSIISWKDVSTKMKDNSVKTLDKVTNRSRPVISEIVTYTEEGQFESSPELYDQFLLLKDRIMSLGNVTTRTTKTGVKYYVDGTRFMEVSCPIHVNDFDLLLNNGRKHIDDPYKMAKDISSNKWGCLTWLVKVNMNSDPDVIMFYVKQAYEANC